MFTYFQSLILELAFCDLGQAGHAEGASRLARASEAHAWRARLKATSGGPRDGAAMM